MGQNSPLITIIIPVYNVRKYIWQCLESVISQTYRNLEILIIDDGSTDGSSIVCDSFAESDRRVTVFHTENRGLSAARNYGLERIGKASSYIAFVDSDDWIEPDMIRRLYDAASRHQADIACCMHTYEFGNKRVIRPGIERECVLEHEECLESFIMEPHIKNVAWNKLYRAELFDSVRFPEGRVYEDIGTTYKIMAAVQKVVVVPDMLYHYRVRKSGLSKAYTMKSLVDRWEVTREMYEYLVPLVSDERCISVLAGGCIVAASSMHRWYYGIPAEKRSIPDPIESEIKEFIRLHYDEVMLDNEYTLLKRFRYSLLRSWDPLTMRILYMSSKLYQRIMLGKLFE